MEKKIKVKYIKYDNDQACENIVKFLKTLFPEINKERWLWEYRENPEYKGIVWVAKCNNKILAHYAFIIGKYVYDNSVYKIAKAEGSLANIKEIIKLPKEKRRVFKKLVNYALDDLKKNNIDFIYGFPNTQAIKSQVEAGYIKKNIPIYISNLIIDFNCYSKKFSNINMINQFFIKIFSVIWKVLFTSYAKYFLKPSLKVKPFNIKMQKKINIFFKKLIEDHPKPYLYKVADFSYIQWRYNKNAYRKNRCAFFHENKNITGFIALSVSRDIKKNKIVHIMDFHAKNIKQFKELIKWAIKFSLSENAMSLDMWSSKPSLYEFKAKNFLMHSGFLKRFRKVKKIFILKSFNKNLNEKNIKFNTMRYLERP